MHLIGIVGKAYNNIDNDDIFQTRDELRRYLSLKDDVICITLLPTNKERMLDIEEGKDEVDPKIDYILDKCDGFVVPGGTYSYHFDEYVIKYAIEHDKPLLALCLGFQLMCSMFAKNRDRFDKTDRLEGEYHHGGTDTYKHELLIENGTKLRNIIGADKIKVNSNHHDIINFEMNELIVNSYSDDGVIE